MLSYLRLAKSSINSRIMLTPNTKIRGTMAVIEVKGEIKGML